jgi:predicted AlkP superfamily pyrophosphatase or phosphodiesterase
MTHLLCVVLLLLALVPHAASAAKTAVPAQTPKLVVVISVDQLGGDLLANYRGKFKAGFKTLLESGIVYPSGFQSHAASETCPGHATILTGRHPAATGIVANRWVDAATGKEVYCTDSAGFTVEGSKLISGPANLMVPTLGDWLKDAAVQNRVFAVAGKDRSAIMMAGHKADGVYWLNDSNYQMTTYVGPGESSHAIKMAPLEKFNAALKSAWAKKPPQWKLLDKTCPAKGGSLQSDTIVWQSSAPPAGWPIGKELPSGLLRASPVWDEVVAAAATDLLVSQKLGRGAGIDVLAVGLSATDYVGHAYGALGAEMCDQLAQLDVILGNFIAALDRQKTPYVLVLTADHGGLDVVERLNKNGYTEAQRLAPFTMSEIFDALNDSIRQQFVLAVDPFTAVNASRGAPELDQLTLVPEIPVTQRAAILAAAQTLLKQNARIADVFVTGAGQPATAPAGLPPTEWTLAQRVAANVYPGRVGDLYVLLQPGTAAAAARGYTAGHGSPYDYDRRVPILFYGAGIPAQERPLPIDTVDIAPTLAHVLGFTPPTAVDGRCLTLAGFPSGVCKGAK